MEYKQCVTATHTVSLKTPDEIIKDIVFKYGNQPTKKFVIKRNTYDYDYIRSLSRVQFDHLQRSLLDCNSVLSKSLSKSNNYEITGIYYKEIKMNDKIKHFGIGLLFGAVSIAFKNIDVLEWFFWLSIAVFVGKEVYDCYKTKPTGFSKLDIFADFLGFGIGLILTNYIWGLI